jgi:hypothetical protein
VNKAAAKYDQQRLSAFLDAAASGDVDVVQDMLRQGMAPNTADYDGRTALMIAAFKGHKVGGGCAAVAAAWAAHALVLAAGARVACTTRPANPTHPYPVHTTRARAQDVVLALLFVGAAMGLKDARGFDVMIEAARGGHPDIINLLKRSGGRVGVSPMLQVCLVCGDVTGVGQRSARRAHAHPQAAMHRERAVSLLRPVCASRPPATTCTQPGLAAVQGHV